MSNLSLKCMVLFVGFAFSGKSQLIYPSYSDSLLHQNTIEIDGIGEYHGTSMKSEFSNKLLFGGFIDNDMKGRSFDKHTDINRFGVNLNGEVRYIHGAGKLFKRDTVTWMVKAGAIAVGNLNYGQDVFGLIFYGNSSYLDNSVTLTNTKLDFMQFQKVGWGIVSKKNKSSVTLNVVNVQNYAEGYVRKGELKQNEDASQIDLIMNGDFQYATGAGFSKGLGVSIDLDYRILVPWLKESVTTFQLSAQNLGIAYLSGGVKRYEADSTYTYSGFQVDAFQDSKNPLGSDFSLLDSLGISYKTVKKLVPLPGYIQIMKLVDMNAVKQLQSFFGIRLYPTFNSIPLVFGGVYWKTTSKLHTSASLSYGNFGNLKGGVYFTLLLKKANWMIGTDNILGAIARVGFGESIVTKLIWKLN